MITCSNNGASGQSVMMTIHRIIRHQAQNATESKKRGAIGPIGPIVSAEPFSKEVASDTNMRTVRQKNAVKNVS